MYYAEPILTLKNVSKNDELLKATSTVKTLLSGCINTKFFFHLVSHCLSKYHGLEAKQKPLCFVFVRVYVNLCTVTELIVFSYNKATIHLG